MSQITVCQVLHGLEVGGAEMLAARLARQLGERFRFVFACLDHVGSLGSSLRDEGFTVHVLERQEGIDRGCVGRLAAFCRGERVDLLHAHQYTPFFYSQMARLLYRRPPILFTEHGRHFPDFPRLKRKIANRLLLERRDRVVAVGQAVRTALVQNEGLPPHRIGVIYNGIELSSFDSTQPLRKAVRAELSIEPERFVIAQVARLDPLKDHATALRSLKRLIAVRPEALLLIVGEGPERTAIEAHVAALGLADHVRLLGLRDNVPRLLQAADLVLLTSRSEGIPLTLIEAMATALPVLSTDVGGVPEVVDDGQSGLLAPAGDDAALACHAVSLIDNPDRAKRLGQCGLDRARAHFCERQMHDHYAALYDGVAPKRPSLIHPLLSCPTP